MSNNHNIQPKVIGKILLIADIINKSPMIIASGLDDIADFEVIKTPKGVPFIPASGVAGMMRALQSENTPTYLWGTSDLKDAEKNKKQITQSHIIIDDLTLKKTSAISIRDGVAINVQTHKADDSSKYDYELLEPGAVFQLKIEITVREGTSPDDYLMCIGDIIQNGKAGRYQQGAFKSNGFGVLMGWETAKVYHFDFTQSGHGELWFDYLQSNTLPNERAMAVEKLPHSAHDEHKLVIEGVFSIHNALIIGSEKEGVALGVDKAHLKNANKEILFTAKSARGPIRHRALRILKTIGREDSASIVDNLFGFVNKDTKRARKGRLKSHESVIMGANHTQAQPRIKIDRFTGGTVESALLQTQPLWHHQESIHLKFEIEYCTEDEAALMLLVMKDAMTADLPFGGEKAIGRGLLKGKSLSIIGKINGKDYHLLFTDKGIADGSQSQISTLNTWIQRLNSPSDGK